MHVSLLGFTKKDLDQAMGEQMIGVRHAADVANRVVDTVVKGFGFGDRVCKILQQLESAEIALLGQWGTLTDAAAHYDASGDTQHGPQVRARPLRCCLQPEQGAHVQGHRAGHSWRIPHRASRDPRHHL